MDSIKSMPADIFAALIKSMAAVPKVPSSQLFLSLHHTNATRNCHFPAAALTTVLLLLYHPGPSRARDTGSPCVPQRNSRVCSCTESCRFHHAGAFRGSRCRGRGQHCCGAPCAPPRRWQRGRSRPTVQGVASGGDTARGGQPFPASAAFLGLLIHRGLSVLLTAQVLSQPGLLNNCLTALAEGRRPDSLVVAPQTPGRLDPLLWLIHRLCPAFRQGCRTSSITLPSCWQPSCNPLR